VPSPLGTDLRIVATSFIQWIVDLTLVKDEVGCEAEERDIGIDTAELRNKIPCICNRASIGNQRSRMEALIWRLS
jgi:hypothetical protein